jgi:hypothetical protein
MVKKIAVLVRDRQGEALRMALGITLKDDIVKVFVLDRKVEETEDNNLNIETMRDLDVNFYTNYKANGHMEYLSTEEIARKILECDHIIPY